MDVPEELASTLSSEDSADVVPAEAPGLEEQPTVTVAAAEADGTEAALHVTAGTGSQGSHAPRCLD